MKNNRGNKKNTFTRLIKTLFEFYPVLLPIIITLILFNSVVSSIPSIFIQNIIAVIEKILAYKDWLHAKLEVLSFVTVLLILYILSLIASFTYNRLMAVVTRGSLMKFRERCLQEWKVFQSVILIQMHMVISCLFIQMILIH